MPESRFNSTATASRILLVLALITPTLVTPALAQNLRSETPAAASGPAFDVSAGYSFLAMQLPGAGNVNLNGIDASAGIHITRHWGAVADSGYVRGSDVFVAGHNSYVLSALAGPVFYPFERNGTWMFLRALGGAGLVDSAVPVTGQSYSYLHGWVTRPSYGVGAGVEHSLFGPFAIRVNGDYLRTGFVNSADSVQLQSNIRLTASIVVRLREGLLASR